MSGVLDAARAAAPASLWTAFLLLFCSAAVRAEIIDRIVAVVNDRVITLSELEAATAVAAERFGEKAGGDKAGVSSRILDRLIEQKLVKIAADKAGIDVSEKEIDNAIDDVKKNNNMTQEALLLALANKGISYIEYRDQIKEQIRQVKFMSQNFRAKVNVKDEEVEDYYRRNLEEFYGPDRLHLRLIYIGGADERLRNRRLRAVLDGLAEGVAFEELARRYSDGPNAADGGDMGFIAEGELSRELAVAARGLAEGEVSPPVAGPGGVSIVKLVERRAGEPLPFEEVRERIYSTLYSRHMQELFDIWIEEVRDSAHIEVRL